MKGALGLLFMLFMIIPLGAQWGPDVRLTESGKATPAMTGSVAASLGGLVHVVWADARDGNLQIYYRRASNGGAAWGDEVRLTRTQSTARNPTVSVAGAMNPVIHVIWEDDRDGNDEIYYKRSTDWGMTWMVDARLTAAADSSVQPMVQGCVCCGAYVRVIWVDKRNGNADIYYKYSTDNGANWSEDVRITDDDAGKCAPSVAFACSLVQAVWTENQNGSWSIRKARSVNDGRNWEVDAAFSESTPRGWHPNVVHFDSSFHIFWITDEGNDGSGPCELSHRRSTNLGGEWQEEARLTKPGVTDAAAYPSCTMLGRTLHVTWAHPKGVYYLRSTDDGVRWDKECGIARPGKGKVSSPAVAVEGRNVHVVWGLEQEGRVDLFYRRNPTGNPVYSK